MMQSYEEEKCKGVKVNSNMKFFMKDLSTLGGHPTSSSSSSTATLAFHSPDNLNISTGMSAESQCPYVPTVSTSNAIEGLSQSVTDHVSMVS